MSEQGAFALAKWFVTLSLLSTCLLCTGLLRVASADEAASLPARQLYQRAATALLAKNVPLASSELSQLVEQYPEDDLAPLAALRLAECHLAQGQSDRAIEVLNAWRPKLAGSARTQALNSSAMLRAELVLARAYFMADNLLEVIKIAEEQADIYRGLGQPSAAQSRLLEQIQTLSEQASQRREQSQAKHLREAAEQVRTKRYAEGLQSLAHCRPKELGAAWLWRYRLLHAQCLLGTGDANGAWEELEQIQFDGLAQSELAAVRMARLDVAMARQQAKQAQTEVEALTALVDGDEFLEATVSLRAVEVATLRKDRETARRLALAAKEQYPRFSAAHEFDLLLARNALASIQFDEARRILASLVAAPPKHDPSAAPRAQWLIGESYFLSQDYRQAVTAYTAAIEDGSAPAWTEVALMQRGKCYELLGELGSASADYRRVSEEFERSSFASTARARLGEIDNYVRTANAGSVPTSKLK